MSLNLDEMSLDELKKLHKDVAKAIETYEERARAEARLKLERQAQEMGFKLEDLMAAAPKRKRQKNPPKYRHPENPAITWTGMGRKPGWVEEALAQGQSLDDLLIR